MENSSWIRGWEPICPNDHDQPAIAAQGFGFASPDSRWDSKEIACDDEVMSAEELHVDLPEPMTDFNGLARALANGLPLDDALPLSQEALGAWRKKRRQQLHDVVKAPEYAVHGKSLDSNVQQNVRVTWWRLQVGDDWTLPAVELEPKEPKATVLVVADNGYRSQAADIQQRLDDGYRVLTLDPFYVGGSRIKSRDHLFALFVSCVGYRAVGLQAGQIVAVARWLEGERRVGPVQLEAFGEQTSLASLVAAALEGDAISRLCMHGSLGSLKEVIERNDSVEKKPFLFCFGLLAQLDVRQIVALVAPRKVEFVSASDRVRHEMQPMRDWYRGFGVWELEFE